MEKINFVLFTEGFHVERKDKKTTTMKNEEQEKDLTYLIFSSPLFLSYSC